MYKVYVIYSQLRDRYYVGSTGVEIELRLKRHNAGWTRSTKSGIPWELKYLQSCVSKADAIQIEKNIKRQKSRSFIIELIASEFNEIKSDR